MITKPTLIAMLFIIFAACTTSPPPNIVVILADDLGYGDISLYDGWVETPNIDQMAREGVKFTDFHSNGSICSPSRAAFLTGRYQQRSGIVGVIVGYRDSVGLEPTEITIPSLLKNAGYKTAIFGKWHCGTDIRQNPVNHGFDEFIGFLPGGCDYHNHKDWYDGKEKKEQEGYSTHIITEKSIDFIRRNKENPFFLYVAHQSVHNFYQIPDDPPDLWYRDIPLSGEEAQRRYQIMLKDLDDNVGQVLGAIKEAGIDDNTFVFFFSDNGDVRMSPMERPFRGGKFSNYEGGHRIPAVARMPGKIKEAWTSGQLSAGTDLLPTIMDLAGIDIPEDRVIDGISLKNHLFKQKEIPDRQIFFGCEPRLGTAMRDGNWKMLTKGDQIELYDLSTDIKESTNVADQHPERTKMMKSIIEEWKKDVRNPGDSSAVKIENLRCANINNPVGIDLVSPPLSWQIKDQGVRGEKQTAYRIIVASSPDKLRKGKADLWDSGKVNSDQSVHLPYKGKELKSRMKCFWKVMIWDKDGKPSDWSEPASWAMGLLKKTNWSAQWIGSPDSVTAPYYRKSFNLDARPEQASIYLASLGYYELYINGEKVGDEVLAPAVSNYTKRTYYNTYDVASYLKKGKNDIGIWMGTGWYTPGYPGVVHKSPVVRAQLETPDKKIITDTSWETKASSRSRTGSWGWGKFGGELLDARLIEEFWWDDEKSGDGWKTAVNVDTPDVPCTAQPCRNNAMLESILPIFIEQLDDSTVVVDFGTNLTGMMSMKMHGLTSGQKIIIHYADLDGRDPAEAWRVSMGHKGFATYNQFDEFISAGKNEEEFNNKFNYHGYRYALVENLPYLPAKEDFAAIPVETEVPEAGSFSCSNELYNDIHKMVRWTYRALNLGGQTVDCPHRERVGYGDGQTAMDVGCYNFDASTLYTKWSENWWDEQQEDGFVPFVAPTPHPTGGGPAWGAMSIMVPWKTYLFYGDTALLKAGYPYMKKYLEYLGNNSPDGLLQDMFPGDKWKNLGDWVPPRRGMDKSEWVDDDSRRFFNNCYRTHLIQIMMKIGAILKENSDVDNFKKELGVAQKAIHANWFNPEDTTYANGEQPYLIFPLQTGITPPELQDAVFQKYISTMIIEDKGHLNTGMVGTQITFDYLLENGRNDLIDIMVNKKTYPGWGYMIEKGATTCWEQWNGYYSQIHSCFPYIGGWFFRGLGGIQWDNDKPGFKNIILCPSIVESVDWVNCNYESAYGTIVSNWKQEADEFNWEVTVPPNSTATVFIPGKEIKADGLDAAEAEGITFLKHKSNSGVFKIEAGSYIFTSTHESK